MNFAWIDLETTGTDEATDSIIEVGVVITDEQLNTLAEGGWVVAPSAWPEQINGHVVKMHAANGLWSDVPNGRDTEDVDRELAGLLDTYKDGGKIALAGSGVGHFDARFIKAHLPQSQRRLTYWPMDIGVVRRFATLILGEPKQQGHEKDHRALNDARWHVQEARHWQEVLGGAA